MPIKTVGQILEMIKPYMGGGKYCKSRYSNYARLVIEDKIDESNVKQLGEALEQNTKKIDLILGGGHFNIKNLDKKFTTEELKAIKELSRIIKTNPKIRSFTMDKYFFGDLGAQYLSEVLDNPQLVSLGFYCCAIGDMGVQAICKKLKNNNTLRHLNLSANLIGNEGVKNLLEMLETNRSIMSLGLTYAKISKENVAYLIEVLVKNKTLLAINYDFASENMSIEQEQRINDLIAKNCKLRNDFIMAAANSDTKTIELLFQHGVSINCVDVQSKVGWTALHYASFNGDINLVKFLVENGADINCLTDEYNTACELAEANKHYDISNYLALQSIKLTSANYNAAEEWSQLGDNYFLGNILIKDNIIARACYLQALKIDENHEHAFAILGYLYLIQKKLLFDNTRKNVVSTSMIPSIFTANQWFEYGKFWYLQRNYKYVNACYINYLLLKEEHPSPLFDIARHLSEKTIQAQECTEYFARVVYENHFESIKPLLHNCYSNMSLANDWLCLARSFFLEGIKNPLNYNFALACFEIATQIDPCNIEALNQLGDMYVKSEGMWKNRKTAREYYEKAVNLGDLSALAKIVKMDYAMITTAEEWINMGDKFHDDINDKLNNERARICYEEALKLDPNNYKTLIKLGLLCEMRLNQVCEAVKYYELAINHAAESWFYLLDKLISIDPVKLLENLSNRSNFSADDLLKIGNFYYNSSNKITQKYSKAAKWFEKAREKGSAEAYRMIGVMSEKGLNDSINFVEVARLYQQALEKGCTEARSNLEKLFNKEDIRCVDAQEISKMYRDGIGVKSDVQQADKWYRLSMRRSAISHPLTMFFHTTSSSGSRLESEQDPASLNSYNSDRNCTLLDKQNP